MLEAHADRAIPVQTPERLGAQPTEVPHRDPRLVRAVDAMDAHTPGRASRRVADRDLRLRTRRSAHDEPEPYIAHREDLAPPTRVRDVVERVPVRDGPGLRIPREFRRAVARRIGARPRIVARLGVPTIAHPWRIPPPRLLAPHHAQRRAVRVEHGVPHLLLHLARLAPDLPSLPRRRIRHRGRPREHIAVDEPELLARQRHDPLDEVGAHVGRVLEDRDLEPARIAERVRVLEHEDPVSRTERLRRRLGMEARVLAPARRGHRVGHARVAIAPEHLARVVDEAALDRTRRLAVDPARIAPVVPGSHRPVGARLRAPKPHVLPEQRGRHRPRRDDERLDHERFGHQRDDDRDQERDQHIGRRAEGVVAPASIGIVGRTALRGGHQLPKTASSERTVSRSTSRLGATR